MSGLYLVVFSLCAVFGNLSWPKVTSMNCMPFGEVGVRGCWLSVGVPNMHSMSGLSLARHVHDIMRHVHWSSHCGLFCLVV